MQLTLDITKKNIAIDIGYYKKNTATDIGYYKKNIAIDVGYYKQNIAIDIGYYEKKNNQTTLINSGNKEKKMLPFYNP